MNKEYLSVGIFTLLQFLQRRMLLAVFLKTTHQIFIFQRLDVATLDPLRRCCACEHFISVMFHYTKRRCYFLNLCLKMFSLKLFNEFSFCQKINILFKSTLVERPQHFALIYFSPTKSCWELILMVYDLEYNFQPFSSWQIIEIGNCERLTAYFCVNKNSLGVQEKYLISRRFQHYDFCFSRVL